MTSPATQVGYHAGRVPANKGLKFPVEVLTPDEAKALIRACSAASHTGIRNRALIAVMYVPGRVEVGRDAGVETQGHR